MSDFDPNGPGAPRIEHAIVDEQAQMQRYLADIAMFDLEMLPPESARRVRPGSLLDQYKIYAAEQHAIEAENNAAPVKEMAGEPASGEVLQAVRTADEVLRASPRFERHIIAEFVGNGAPEE